MKKIIQNMTLIGLLGLMSTGPAVAAFPDLTAGPNPITQLQCTKLANDISIIISSGVVGSIDCTTDATNVALSVCHTTGLTTSRTVSVSPTPDANNNPSCNTPLTLNTTTNMCEGTITGVAFPTATTAQGTVTSRYPNQEVCSTATAATEAAGAL